MTDDMAERYAEAFDRYMAILENLRVGSLGIFERAAALLDSGQTEQALSVLLFAAQCYRETPSSEPRRLQ